MNKSVGVKLYVYAQSKDNPRDVEVKEKEIAVFPLMCDICGEPAIFINYRTFALRCDKHKLLF